MSLLSKETGQHSWPVVFRTLHALPSPTRQLHPQAHADACIDYFLFPERGHIFMPINFAQTVCSPTISNPTRPLSLYSNVISFINPALNPLVRALSPVSPQHWFPDTAPVPWCFMFMSLLSPSTIRTAVLTQWLWVNSEHNFSCVFSVNVSWADYCRLWKGIQTDFRHFCPWAFNLSVNN